ncbi:ArsR/SmtB family transcription factor [Thermobifida halotolerans]|uniref:ArsR/SmtB family transcription factor n=1 Tax=Thermobifida halotolerans TaxID=483545 RepID=UPI000B0E8C53|nr:metalloregulator ArsR/SmtB family transcription factor [Thermobifida halotolerans]
MNQADFSTHPAEPGTGDGRPPPNSEAALSAETAERIADTLRALADPTRLRLLTMLLNAPSGEACVQDLATPLATSQPTVSHHLKILAAAGLVRRDRRGKRSWYSIREERVALVRGLLG